MVKGQKIQLLQLRQNEQYAKMDFWEQGDERNLKKKYDDLKQEYDQLNSQVQLSSNQVQVQMDTIMEEQIQDEVQKNQVQDVVQDGVAVTEPEEAGTQQSTSNQIFTIEDDIPPANNVKSTNEVVQVSEAVKVAETIEIPKEVEVVGEISKQTDTELDIPSF
ncbi:hypothetical protein GOP47_0011085 [Adiantum capillus-veneris]|uniref:Uncharacterized protein n=1 Tax=Adiantum capillus-veneris TaxID=13818 RepID=A0A9D4ZGE0_ADICA|nr:hypothetical protein GOP47_0011085 [Adiantum capillus-veneris]